ncbi:MAG: DNA methyltransferase [Candidatus Aenigmatarchaeota archaeon]
MNQSELKKHKEQLIKLFESDCANLDFGIYRIMNYKRQVIEKWIKVDLPRLIYEEMSNVVMNARAHSQAKDPNLCNYESIESALYNHLYTFFSLYWQDGNFISKHYYSKKERYVIPYNDEEVYFYWVNRDQYYIKTGEHFTDYTYKTSDGVTVLFKIQQVNIEQNNVKGEKRFFLPLLDIITWNEKERTLIIPFEFRPLKDEELKIYGYKNQQEVIISKTVKSISIILQKIHNVILNDHTSFFTLLKHHLRRYTRNNTRDFFIHKDLRSFLLQELDFYLKNEVLNLDDLETSGEHLAEDRFQLMRLIKRVGKHIIEFMAQIEDFQKMLWEKKKFISETFYIITVGNIPSTFYPEIAVCEKQWDEWEKLGMLNNEWRTMSVEERYSFLIQYSSLPLDTRHFSLDFTDRLLASFENLDDLTDGLLVNSENWQALNLLQEKYRDRVKCIYIDPPFNSTSKDISYKNNFSHSSWLTLLENRISITKNYISDGVYVIAIDENEQERLGMLIRSTWLSKCKAVCVSIRHNSKGTQGKNFSYCHEYAYFIYPSDKKKYIKNSKRAEVDFRNFRDSGTESDRTNAKNCFYPIIIMDDQIVGFGEVASEDYHPSGVNEILPDGRILVWPIDEKGREKKWRYARQSVEQIRDNLKVKKIRDKYEIYFVKDVATVKTIWYDAKFDASEYGTKLLQQMFGSKQVDFSFPKSIYTLMETIYIATEIESLILDYFAGSGTTGHAVINLNREDGGKRKFILVEMAHYFDTILLPRLKKVIFTPEWKDGKPKRMATLKEVDRSPRIIKVIRLESYEDTLNNLFFENPSSQKASGLFKENYPMHYILKWENCKSTICLNVEKFQNPFSYKIRLLRNGKNNE